MNKLKNFLYFSFAFCILLTYAIYNVWKKDYVPLYTQNKNQILWYRHSKILQKVADNSIENGLILGNSYAESAIDPEKLKINKINFSNFTKGGTTSIELAKYLQKHKVYPAIVLLELNGRDLLPRYNVKFDIFPPKKGSWPSIRNQLEIDLSYFFELNFPPLRFKHFPLQYVKNIIKGDFGKLNLKLDEWKTPQINKNYFFKASGHCLHHDSLINNNLTEAYLIRNTPKYTNSNKFDLQNSQLLKQVVKNFLKHRTKVVLFRIPRNIKLNQLEEKGLPILFSCAAKLAETDNVYWLDMGLENINKVYAGLQYDGAHYSESQAQRLSLDFNRRLNKIIQH